MNIHILALIAALLLTIQSCKEGAISDTSALPMESTDRLFDQYDPSAEHAFGQPNPAAPEQNRQFDFMVGTFACDDSLLINGHWKVSKAIWETVYILNGYGVRDTYRNDNYAGTSIRFYNTKKELWDVYFFGMPGEHTGLWEGQHVDGQMVMRQARTGANGEALESRLTFYNITKTSFDWKAELWNLDDDTATVTWKIRARRI